MRILQSENPKIPGISPKEKGGSPCRLTRSYHKVAHNRANILCWYISFHSTQVVHFTTTCVPMSPEFVSFHEWLGVYSETFTTTCRSPIDYNRASHNSPWWSTPTKGCYPQRTGLYHCNSDSNSSVIIGYTIFLSSSPCSK